MIFQQYRFFFALCFLFDSPPLRPLFSRIRSSDISPPLPPFSPAGAITPLRPAHLTSLDRTSICLWRFTVSLSSVHLSLHRSLGLLKPKLPSSLPIPADFFSNVVISPPSMQFKERAALALPFTLGPHVDVPGPPTLRTSFILAPSAFFFLVLHSLAFVPFLRLFPYGRRHDRLFRYGSVPSRPLS